MSSLFDNLAFVHFCPACKQERILQAAKDLWPVSENARKRWWKCSECDTGWLLEDNMVREIVKKDTKK